MKRREFLVVSSGVAGGLLARAVRGQVRPCPAQTVTTSGGAKATTNCDITPSTGPGSAPAWFTAMQDMTWTAVAGGATYGSSYQNGKRVQDVLPAVYPGGNSSASICTAWNGGCVDQTRNAFMLANSGGHGDYAGNEIYALSLMAAVPGWVLLQNPTPPASQTPNLPSGNAGGNNGNATWADGNPASTHNYQRPCCNGQYICLPSLDALVNTAWTTQCWLYNLSSAYAQQSSWPLPNTSGLWSSPGFGLKSTSGGNLSDAGDEGGIGVWDRVNGLFWGATAEGTNGAGQGLWSLNPATGVINTFGGVTNGGMFTSAMCHHLRGTSDAGCIISLNPGGNQIFIVDISNPASPAIHGIGFSSFGGVGVGHGKVYQSANKSILYWNGESHLSKMPIPSDPINGTYSMTTVNWSGSVSPSANQANGTYGRFNIIENMGAPENKAALVILNDISQPTYVLKVPTAGI